MQKLIASVPTGNRTNNKRVAVTIATVFVSGALLWLGATKMSNKSITVYPSSVQVSIDKANPNQRTRRIDQLELGDQIIMTHAESTKVSREAAAFQEFKREIALATQDLDKSDAAVNGIVEHLTSLKACLSLTYFMAKDFFTGGSEVDKIFIAEAEKLDLITSTSTNNAKQAVDQLHTALKMIEGSYTETYITGPASRSVATRLADEAIDGVPVSDIRQLELTKAISFDSSLGSATALLSASALAKTVNRSVWNLFGVVEKKAAKRMAVAAFPAIIDGPLPVGDMIALALESGCLAWSFHEVYEAQGAIKNDLHQELTGVMKQNSKQIRAWAMNVGTELMETAALSVPAPKIKLSVKTHPRK